MHKRTWCILFAAVLTTWCGRTAAQSPVDSGATGWNLQPAFGVLAPFDPSDHPAAGVGVNFNAWRRAGKVSVDLTFQNWMLPEGHRTYHVMQTTAGVNSLIRQFRPAPDLLLTPVFSLGMGAMWTYHFDILIGDVYTGVGLEIRHRRRLISIIPFQLHGIFTGYGGACLWQSVIRFGFPLGRE